MLEAFILAAFLASLILGLTTCYTEATWIYLWEILNSVKKKLQAVNTLKKQNNKNKTKQLYLKAKMKKTESYCLFYSQHSATSLLSSFQLTYDCEYDMKKKKKHRFHGLNLHWS